MASPLVIVVNPRSGADHDVTALQALVRDAGRPCETLVVRKRGQLPMLVAQAQARARESGGTLVAAGGDGTVNAVAQAALDAGLTFGVLPRGTFNYFARLHALPIDPGEALHVLLAGRTDPAQVGLVNRRIFLVNASLGVYPKLLEDREHLKRQYGRSRAVAFAAGLMTLLSERRRLSLRIEHEGESRVLRTSTLFVGNNPLQLERVGLPEATAIEHGQLAAVSIRPVGRWQMLSLALHGALGRLGDAENVDTFAFRALQVMPVGRAGLPVVKVATDGETAWMRWPLRFEVSARPLKLVVP